MALAINLTLVVQIGHFILAYLLISRFFLKPGFEAVMRDTERLARLKDSLVHQEGIVAHTQEDKTARWRRCQVYFSDKKPSLKVITPSVISSEGVEVVTPLSSEQLKEMSNIIVKTLEEQVRHD